MSKGGWVYILTNEYHTVLYTGVTSNLVNRMLDHVQKVYPYSFTSKYNAVKLVYYQLFDTIEEAIAEEKRIKGGSRAAKIKLINSLNAQWKDLWVNNVGNW